METATQRRKKRKLILEEKRNKRGLNRNTILEKRRHVSDAPFRSPNSTQSVSQDNTPLGAISSTYRRTSYYRNQEASQLSTDSSTISAKNLASTSKRWARVRQADVISTNLMSKFGKENINVNEINNDTHTTRNLRGSCGQKPIFPETRMLSSGKYTIQNATLTVNDLLDDGHAQGDNIPGEFDFDSPSTTESEYSTEDETQTIIELEDAGYRDLGDQTYTCCECGAKMWYAERINKDKRPKKPKFNTCCQDGKIQLPVIKDPPLLLQDLLFGDSARSKNFQSNIRSYNLMFAFTSPGAKLDKRFLSGRGPPTYRIQGQNHHLIGSLLPMPDKAPKFAQLYIYDTDNEVQNRLAPYPNRKALDETIVKDLKEMLDIENRYAQHYRMARDKFKEEPLCELKLRLIRERERDGRVYNLPDVKEVAALIVGDEQTGEKRDIIVETRCGFLKRIDELHPAYLPLQYPLLFPGGEDGYTKDIEHKYDPYSNVAKKKKVTMREYFAYRLQERNGEAQTILRSGRLFQQFVVDGYTMIESQRLNYVRDHQQDLRVDKYKNLNASSEQGDTQGSERGKRVILPSTFVGSRRYMEQLYFDGMAICGNLGFPDLFLTFTCNPTWPEIVRKCTELNCRPDERPEILTKVFKMKLDDLITFLKSGKPFGKLLGFVYTIEWQKRGLPHAHILLFLHPSNKYPNPADIDRIISAEIPDQHEHPHLYELVSKHMLHGPCGLANRSSPCMMDGRCTKFFPKSWQTTTIVDKDGFPVYRRRNNGNVVHRNSIDLDNRYVVPYSPLLLILFRAHLNVEWCNQSTSIKYLFKYINKGSDQITAAIVDAHSNLLNIPPADDEIKQYLDCRYVSPCEATWKIFAYNPHGRRPSVERLYFHLKDEHPVYFKGNQYVSSVMKKKTVKESMFTAWMEANKTYPQGKDLTYPEYVTKFVYVAKKRWWQPRKQGFTIARLIWVPPSSGELFFMRMLLAVAKGPTSYEEIRTINGVQYASFREACFALGFIGNDKEFIGAIKELMNWATADYMRKLFVHMLFLNCMDRPHYVWEQTWNYLSDDILLRQRKKILNPRLELSDEELKHICLCDIEDILQRNGKSLREFPALPFPVGYVPKYCGNKLIQAELDYDKEALKIDFNNYYASLTDEQSTIFHKIISAVEKQDGGVFFLYGYGGTGKTFMWKTLAAAVRSNGGIVVTVASSGIASLLLPGGTTAHSKLKIPVPATDTSICNIQQGSELAKLLKVTKLIIWDEAPMCHKHCFEALDRSLMDIMGKANVNNNIFGGKVIVFGGDFRQVLPVVPKGTRSDIVHASINASYIWDHVEVLKLTKNMRLQSKSGCTNLERLNQFSQWLLDVGDGKLGEPNDGYAEITIPDEFLFKDFNDPLEAMVNTIYPNLLEVYNNGAFLQSRAILASTLEVVDSINDYIMSLVPGEEKEYFSADKIDKADRLQNPAFETVTSEFLNSLKASGLPNHKIKLKVGTPIMLIRNMNQNEGLCHGTRLIVEKLGSHIIEAKIITGKNIGHITHIPRMNMSPSESPWPFKLIRRQFPFINSFAMTINKSQGQSLEHVGLYLPKPVFTHGQLYVALSRVQSREGLHILILDSDGKPTNTTTNVVYKEVFNNL